MMDSFCVTPSDPTRREEFTQPIHDTIGNLEKCYRAFFPVSRKVFKTMIWEIPPADWLILQLPTAQAGPHNSH